MVGIKTSEFMPPKEKKKKSEFLSIPEMVTDLMLQPYLVLQFALVLSHRQIAALVRHTGGTG